MENKDFAELIHRGFESDELDYKAHQNWNTMSKAARGKFIRHLIAFANTKGGFLVVGVGEDEFGRPANLTGVSDEEAASFDPTPVGSFINRYVEPPLDFSIERPVVDNKIFVIFIVRRFKTLPHVCVNGLDVELNTGMFYIRTSEASSRPAHRALEMHNLIQRAMRNQREMLGRMLRGILYETRTFESNGYSGVANAYIDSLTSAEIYFKRRRLPPSQSGVMLLKLSVTPGTYRVGEFSKLQLQQAVGAAAVPDLRRAFIEYSEKLHFHSTGGALRLLPPDKFKMWQIFDSGLFFYIKWLPTDGVLDFDYLCRFCLEAIEFLGRFYAELNWQEELLTVSLSLEGVEKFIVPEISEVTSSRINRVTKSITRSAADLASGFCDHADHLLRAFGEAFALSKHQLYRLHRKLEVNCRND